MICTRADKEAASEGLKAEMNLAVDEAVGEGSEVNAAFDFKKAFLVLRVLTLMPLQGIL